jgi:hypothetical protein
MMQHIFPPQTEYKRVLVGKYRQHFKSPNHNQLQPKVKQERELNKHIQDIRRRIDFLDRQSLGLIFWWTKHDWKNQMLNNSGCISNVKQGRIAKHKEYNRVWARYSKHVPNLPFEPGSFCSPSGAVWRPNGIYTQGIHRAVLLINWETGQHRTICFSTIYKAMGLGWKWITDRKLKQMEDTMLRRK